jgi:nucleotide-binding universal stress UspA family protein
MDEQLGSHDLDRQLTADQQAGRVVVGVDGSAASLTALRWAAGVAAATGWSIDVVRAWQHPLNYGWDAGVDAIDWEGDNQKALTAALDEVFGADRPAGLTAYALEGDPAHRLIEHAAGARMLVMGNRGKGGFIGLLMGSVSTKCASHATCPVLIVHADDVAPTMTAAIPVHAAI